MVAEVVNAEVVEEQNMISLEELVKEVTEDVDLQKWKRSEWWSEIPKREQFKKGDIVYHSELGKFGIFIEPARKEGLLKIRLFKRRTKTDVYTRSWFLDFDSVELVKRNDKLSRGYVETEEEFIKRAD